jgi:hypothetical protein
MCRVLFRSLLATSVARRGDHSKVFEEDRPMSTFRTWALAVIGVGACAASAVAGDLARIDRSIGKEPAYQHKPGYCLLVFGPEAKTRVWLVRDGSVLYLDRNGSGDLTEDGKKINGDAPGVTIQGEGQKKYQVGYCRLTKLGNEPKEYCHIQIDVDGIYRQYSFAGFAARTQDAPVVHFDGPLTLEIAGDDVTLARGEKPTELNVYLVTRGQGARLGSTVLVDYSLGVPKDSYPVARIEFPSKAPGGQPVTETYTLKERC